WGSSGLVAWVKLSELQCWPGSVLGSPVADVVVGGRLGDGSWQFGDWSAAGVWVMPCGIG
ncbi:hypothetical protein A2U01_0070588, partial [Trifolium medium]|nr:hypothetical protein [Trifolium medium]